MTDISDETILANRKKVIEYLKNPKLKKAKGVLKNSGGGRCCLGHMCDALGMIPEKKGMWWYYEKDKFSLPESMQRALGMYTPAGEFRTENVIQFYYKDEKYGSHSCLANLNDESTIKPAEIASILETMITGGDGTPWRKIT